VLDNLDATHEGPIRVSDDSAVHLRQGDADGACGPYVVFMALIVLDLAHRDEVTAWALPDGRTKIGKLMQQLGERSNTLFVGGTTLKALDEVLLESFGRDLTTERHEVSGKTALDFIKQHLRQGNPVIVQLDGTDDAHFVLAIGVDGGSGDGPEVDRLLVLDPADGASSVCPWNGVVDARPTGGKFPYTWWTKGDGGLTKVQFYSALALKRKKK
jgi:hypothetical protein